MCVACGVLRACVLSRGLMRGQGNILCCSGAACLGLEAAEEHLRADVSSAKKYYLYYMQKM
jgi:hypothetical protein